MNCRCGNKLDGSNPRQRFCSPACRQAAWRERHSTVTLTVVVDPEVATALAVVAALHGLTRGETLRKITYEWLRSQEAALSMPPHEPAAAERVTRTPDRSTR